VSSCRSSCETRTVWRWYDSDPEAGTSRPKLTACADSDEPDEYAFGSFVVKSFAEDSLEVSCTFIVCTVHTCIVSPSDMDNDHAGYATACCMYTSMSVSQTKMFPHRYEIQVSENC